MAIKILILSGAYYPKHIGGAEVAIKEITDRLSPEEYEFHMVCNRYDDTLPEVEQVGNVLVHRIGITKHEPTMTELKRFPLHLNKLLFQFTAYWKARELHLQYEYDAVWGMMAHACGVPSGLFKRSFPKVTYVLTLQEGDPPEYIEHKMRFFGPLFRAAFRCADIMQCISTFLERWGRRMGFSETSVVIPNAVDTTHFSRGVSNEEIAATKEEIGKRDGETWLIHTGRYVKKNACDDVIRALAELPENVHFFMIGEGPDEAKLKQLVHEQGLEARVHFHSYVPLKEVARYLKACDIFIRPSRSEGMGNSLVEAMAAGLPVIATQEGGIADFLFDAKRNPERGTTGWAVDPDSPEQIARAVERILADPDATRAVTERAFTMTEEKYDWDLIAEHMDEEVFSRIVKGA